MQHKKRLSAIITVFVLVIGGVAYYNVPSTPNPVPIVPVIGLAVTSSDTNAIAKEIDVLAGKRIYYAVGGQVSDEARLYVEDHTNGGGVLYGESYTAPELAVLLQQYLGDQMKLSDFAVIEIQ